VGRHVAQGPHPGLRPPAIRPATRKWSIYWADHRTNLLYTPAVVGSFHAGRGEFFSDGSFGGKPTHERTIWLALTRDTCHWEQAMSLDGGKTWETNWTMDFTRLAP
jgi:hypothetical protein